MGSMAGAVNGKKSGGPFPLMATRSLGCQTSIVAVTPAVALFLSALFAETPLLTQHVQDAARGAKATETRWMKAPWRVCTDRRIIVDAQEVLIGIVRLTHCCLSLVGFAEPHDAAPHVPKVLDAQQPQGVTESSAEVQRRAGTPYRGTPQT